MTSRRSFLLGIGALVSASFVTRVKAHVLEIARPLLLEPKRAEETLYLHEQSGWDDDWKWRVSLGPDDVHEPPPPPTWREHLRPLGYTFETKEDYERAFREMSLEPEDVDKHLDGYHQHHRLCAGGVLSAAFTSAPKRCWFSPSEIAEVLAWLAIQSSEVAFSAFSAATADRRMWSGCTPASASAHSVSPHSAKLAISSLIRKIAARAW